MFYLKFPYQNSQRQIVTKLSSRSSAIRAGSRLEGLGDNAQ
jgi:hypothetical protein